MSYNEEECMSFFWLFKFVDTLTGIVVEVNGGEDEGSEEDVKGLDDKFFVVIGEYIFEH